MKLYETVEALATISGWIDEHADDILANGGELTPALAELLDAAEGDFSEKVERVALKVRELEAEALAVDTEAERLTQRARTRYNAAKSLKAYLKGALEIAGLDKVKATLVTVAIQKNPPSLHGELSQEELDVLARRRAEFVSIVPATLSLNKRAVLDACKAGEALPTGLTISQGTSLRIR